MPKPPIAYTPIDKWSEPLVAVYEAMTDALLVNIAKHFNVKGDVGGSQEWRLAKLAELGKLTEESIAIISAQTGVEASLVRYAIEGAALEAINKIEPDLLEAAKKGLLNPSQATISDAVKRALGAYQAQTIDALNMVNTTMLASTLDAYRQAVANTIAIEERLTAAQNVLNVQTANVVAGISSRTEAARTAIKQIAAKGITGFVDRAGHNWSAEAYVNMDIRTTAGNVALQSTMARNADYGNDLVWVPINATARPKCYPWQGKVISTANRSGTVEDLNGKVYDITPLNQTSYGEPDGLFGINCHHTPPNIFIAGVSVIRGTVPPKEENDRRYAETQTQRAMEREIRYAKRDAAMADASGDKEAFAEASVKVKEATAKYKQYSADHNLPTYLDRAQVNEYNRSVAAKANWAAKKKDNDIAIPPALINPDINKRYTAGASLFDLTDENAARFDATIAELQAKYPTPSGYTLNIGEYDKVTGMLTEGQRENTVSGIASAQAWANHDTKTYIIGYRPQYAFGTYEGELAERREYIKDGKVLDTVFNKASPEGHAIHEYGHVMSDYLTNAMIYDDPVAHEYWDWYRSLAKDEIRKGLSDYAATNRSEFEAEAFAEIMTGAPRSIAKKYRDYLAKAIEKNYNFSEGQGSPLSVNLAKYKNVKNIPTYYLPEKEYKHVMSELATWVKQNECPTGTFQTKHIGDYVYSFERTDNTVFRILGKHYKK